MTVEQYNARLRAFVQDLEARNRPLAVAVISTHTKVCKRIFVDGIKSNGAAIGKYNDTKELYVYPDRTFGNTSGLKPPRGKDGKTVFTEGKHKGESHKTTYVKSYKELRKIVGRPTDTVNFVASGDLQSDFKKENTVTKINSNEYVVRLDREKNVKKIAGLQEKFGQTTHLLKSEHVHCEKTCLLELINDLKKAGLA